MVLPAEPLQFRFLVLNCASETGICVLRLGLVCPDLFHLVACAVQLMLQSGQLRRSLVDRLLPFLGAGVRLAKLLGRRLQALFQHPDALALVVNLPRQDPILRGQLAHRVI